MSVEEFRAVNGGTDAAKLRSEDPFNDYLETMKVIHQKKGHDYAQSDNMYLNFERQRELMSWFADDQDKMFAGIIAQKLARIAQLRKGKEPKNESLKDSYIDAANYILLWLGYLETQR